MNPCVAQQVEASDLRSDKCKFDPCRREFKAKRKILRSEFKQGKDGTWYVSRRFRKRLYCLRGHRLTKQNTILTKYLNRVKRCCRICKNKSRSNFAKRNPLKEKLWKSLAKYRKLDLEVRPLVWEYGTPQVKFRPSRKQLAHFSSFLLLRGRTKPKDIHRWFRTMIRRYGISEARSEFRRLRRKSNRDAKKRLAKYHLKFPVHLDKRTDGGVEIYNFIPYSGADPLSELIAKEEREMEEKYRKWRSKDHDIFVLKKGMV